MDEWSMWETFITTGSVLDYIRYKSIQDAKDMGIDTVNREETKRSYQGICQRSQKHKKSKMCRNLFAVIFPADNI